LLVAALLGMTSWNACADGRELFAGAPAGTTAVQVLRNPGFLVGYSAQHRQPLWVAYRAESLKGRRPYKRDDRFEPDPRVAEPVKHWDYKGSGYTRGHLAPAYLIGRLYGRAAQSATFLMSNISPQKDRLNQMVWQRLEQAESDTVAPGAVELWVVTGPVFDPRRTLKKSGIALPAAFYRVWLDVRDGRPAALAFIVPQDVCGTEPLSHYLASVDEVERRTGLDFFHELADAEEAAFEAGTRVEGWRLDRYDKRPPKYGDTFDLSTCPNP
jgi:endonuclease G